MRKNDFDILQPQAVTKMRKMMADLVQAWNDLELAIGAMPESALQHRLVLHLKEASGWNEARNIPGVKESIAFITKAIISNHAEKETKQEMAMRLEKVQTALDAMIEYLMKKISK